MGFVACLASVCIVITSNHWLQVPAIMEDKLGDATDFIAAIERFTEAIQLNRGNYQLWSQRSAALARVGKYQEALEDAKRCHELKPDWPKVSVTMTALFSVASRRGPGVCCQ